MVYLIIAPTSYAKGIKKKKEKKLFAHNNVVDCIVRCSATLMQNCNVELLQFHSLRTLCTDWCDDDTKAVMLISLVVVVVLIVIVIADYSVVH